MNSSPVSYYLRPFLIPESKTPVRLSTNNLAVKYPITYVKPTNLTEIFKPRKNKKLLARRDLIYCLQRLSFMKVPIDETLFKDQNKSLGYLKQVFKRAKSLKSINLFFVAEVNYFNPNARIVTEPMLMRLNKQLKYLKVLNSFTISTFACKFVKFEKDFYIMTRYFRDLRCFSLLNSYDWDRNESIIEVVTARNLKNLHTLVLHLARYIYSRPDRDIFDLFESFKTLKKLQKITLNFDGSSWFDRRFLDSITGSLLALKDMTHINIKMDNCVKISQKDVLDFVGVIFKLENLESLQIDFKIQNDTLIQPILEKFCFKKWKAPAMECKIALEANSIEIQSINQKTLKKMLESTWPGYNESPLRFILKTQGNSPSLTTLITPAFITKDIWSILKSSTVLPKPIILMHHGQELEIADFDKESYDVNWESLELRAIPALVGENTIKGILTFLSLFSKNFKYVSLGLGSCNYLGNDDLKTLAIALRSLTELKTLKFDSCFWRGIKDSGVLEFVSTLDNFEKLETLLLDYSGSDISDNSVVKLLEVVEKKTLLKSLTLNFAGLWSPLNKPSFEKLTKSLSGLKLLEYLELNLGDNKTITDNEFTNLSKTIGERELLKVLVLGLLRCDKIGDKGLETTGFTLLGLKNLEKFSMNCTVGPTGKTNMSPKGVIALTKSIKKCEKLIDLELNLSGVLKPGGKGTVELDTVLRHFKSKRCNYEVNS